MKRPIGRGRRHLHSFENHTARKWTRHTHTASSMPSTLLMRDIWAAGPGRIKSWGHASKDNSMLDSAAAVPVSLDSAATQHAAVPHELPSGGGAATATPPATLNLLATFAFTPALRIRVRSPKLKRESPG